VLPVRHNTDRLLPQRKETDAARPLKWHGGMRPARGLIFLELIASAFAIAGCGTYVDYTPLDQPRGGYSARPPRTVEVYASGPPARRHTDIAIIEAEQTHSLNEQSTGLMIRRMREQAAAIGCDAIVLGGATDHAGAPPGSSLYFLDPGSTKRQATCIVYEDPPTREFSRTAPRRANRGAPQAEDDEDPR
jgi:hypothetical protein